MTRFNISHHQDHNQKNSISETTLQSNTVKQQEDPTPLPRYIPQKYYIQQNLHVSLNLPHSKHKTNTSNWAEPTQHELQQVQHSGSSWPQTTIPKIDHGKETQRRQWNTSKVLTWDILMLFCQTNGMKHYNNLLEDSFQLIKNTLPHKRPQL